MPLRFKFVLVEYGKRDIVHIWEWLKSVASLTMEEVSSETKRMFALPPETHVIFTLNDGEDDLTISSTDDLQLIIKDHLANTGNAPCAVLKAIRLKVLITDKKSITSDPIVQPALLEPITRSTRNNEVQVHSSCSPLKCIKHVRVTCDGCEGGVFGIRYKCLYCPDYDLCSECYDDGKHLEHQFIAIRHGNSQKENAANVFQCIQTARKANFNLLRVQTPSAPTLSVVTGSSDQPTSAEPVGKETDEWEVLSDNSEEDLIPEFCSEGGTKKSYTHVVTDDSAIGTVAPQFENCKEAHAVLVEPVVSQVQQFEVQSVACPLNTPIVSLPVQSRHSSLVTATCESFTSGAQTDSRHESSDAFVSASLQLSSASASTGKCAASGAQTYSQCESSSNDFVRTNLRSPSICTATGESVTSDAQTDSPNDSSDAFVHVNLQPSYTSATNVESITCGAQTDSRHESPSSFNHASQPPPTAPPQHQWDITALLQSHISDALKNLVSTSSNEVRTLEKELQILLSKGYSNEGGVLEFLLSENGNSAAAVLDILRHQP